VRVVASASKIARRHATVLRLGAVVALFVGLWVGAWTSGLLDTIEIDAIRESTGAWGWLGIGAFFVLTCGGNLLQIPAMVFIVAAIVAWGPALGGIIGWSSATTASCATFLLVRAIGGRALGGLEHPWARRMLGGLERSPIRTIVVLRLFMQGAAPLNAALALTPVGFGRYALATALGLIPPTIVAALLTELFV
jgi:uncharacterized membrane protein YdjX (TVP38/TMEM64 family)